MMSCEAEVGHCQQLGVVVKYSIGKRADPRGDTSIYRRGPALWCGIQCEAAKAETLNHLRQASSVRARWDLKQGGGGAG